MQSYVVIYWLLVTLAMLKVWKAPAYLQTHVFPISFLMRNGTFKCIQLKNDSRLRFFLYVKIHNVYFKTVILLADTQFLSLPKVIKKIKPTPRKAFFIKNVVFWKLYHVSKNRDTVLRFAYIRTISPNKNEKRASRLGVESRIVKISVFPQNAKTMSYD